MSSLIDSGCRVVCSAAAALAALHEEHDRVLAELHVTTRKLTAFRERSEHQQPPFAPSILL